MNLFLLSNSLNVKDVIQKSQLQMMPMSFSLAHSIPKTSESALLDVLMEPPFLENSNMLFDADVQEL